MVIKRKWMKIFALAMMGMAAGFGPVNPKELAEMMHIMDEGKIEFSIPDDSDCGDGDRWWRADIIETEEVQVDAGDNAFGTK